MIESRKVSKPEIDTVAVGGNTSRHFCLCPEGLRLPHLGYMILS
jgi:hypothetical protein